MIIPARFNGPPGTANGGYTAGLLALCLDSGKDFDSGKDAVEVTLHRPPPLDTELTVRPSTIADIRLYDDDQLIAEAVFTTLGADEVVPAVPFAEAVSASLGYRGLVSHPFPGCFVCGPDRAPGDGLRLFPGPLADGRTATPFVVPDEISPELVWAALDCPGGWSAPMEARPYVLGRIAARIDAIPLPSQECVVMGLMVGEEGRKAYVHSTVYGPEGELLATARATWFAR